MKIRNLCYGRSFAASLLASFCFAATASAQNGVWTSTIEFGNWSDAGNWQGGTVANGAGNTADFSTLDLPDSLFPFTLVLDSPRTIGHLTFGDTDPSTSSGWLIENNFEPTNVLTLATASGAPVVTVNDLGDEVSAEINAVVAGTAGLAKAGSGALALSGANTYSGTTELQEGRLDINSPTAIGTGPLVVSGGSLGNSSMGAVALTTNNPQTWNTDVIFHGPSNLNLGTGAVTSAAAREITVEAGVLTWGGALAMPGFTKSGAGELLLSGNNTVGLVGDITLKEGLVRLGGGAGNGQNAIGSPTNPIIFEGGALAVNGSTGNNGVQYAAFTNPMFVDAGQTGTIYHSQRSTGVNAFSAPLTGSGTFNFVANYVRGEVNADWSGFTGQINVSAGGGGAEFRLAGTNHFTNAKLHLGAGVYVHQIFNPPNNAVGTTHNIGELSGDVGAILAGHPVAGRFVNWSVGALNTDSTFAGVIEATLGTWGLGEPRLYKVGTGTLTLTGANTYAGETEVNAGTLQIGDGGATGSLGNTNVSVASGASLVFNRDDSATSTYPGILAGAGNVIKRGAGTVHFTGENTYSTGTLIEGGRIGINNNASLGLDAAPVSFAVSDGGILATAPAIVSTRTFDIASGVTATFGAATAADSYMIGGTISGDGALAVDGAGIVRLSAANTYAGNTTVNSGTLAVANATGSATSTGTVTVNGGALAGAGTIAGAVTVAAAGDIKPGAITTTSSSVGDLTVGSLALAGGAEMFIELKSGSNDRVVVTSAGGLTTTANAGNPVLVDLRQENSTAKWITPGTYPIIQFNGPFTGDADAIFEVNAASQQAGLTYNFQTSGNTVQLVIGGADPSIWNVNADGNWSNAANWQNGVPSGTGAVAQFNDVISQPRTVTLDGNRTIGFAQFNSEHAYTIAGGSTLSFDQHEGNAQIGILAGSHTITANVNLVDTLDINIQDPQSTLSLLGAVSGPGGNVKSSAGNLVLGGNNTFGGDVIFSNGTLTFAEGGLGAGDLAIDNATLVWMDGNTQDISGRDITFGNTAVTFSMNGDVLLTNDIGGAGTASFAKDGFGALTLAADTSFTGNVDVRDGALVLGNGGATGSVSGNIALTQPISLLRVNRSAPLTMTNVISGSGDLRVSGSGTLSLNADNPFTGFTRIDAGSTLSLLNSAALRASTLVFETTGGELDVDPLFALTLGGLEGDKDLPLLGGGFGIPLTVGGNGLSSFYSGTLSGLGASLTKTGVGVLTLSAPQEYDGFTAVNGGTLEFATGSSVTTTSASVSNTGLLLINGGQLTANANTSIAPGGTGGLHILDGSATFNAALTDTNADGGLILVDGGSLTAASMSFGRTQTYGNGADPAPAAVGEAAGLVVRSGAAEIIGNLALGTSNSSASALVSGGELTVGGVVNIGNTSNDRWSRMEVRDGTFTSTSETGIILSPSAGTANRSQFYVTGGVATVERIGFGAENSAAGATGRLTIEGSGTLYLGAGGLAEGSLNVFTPQIQLFGGTLAAKADWSSDFTIDTANLFEIRAADAASNPFDITLNGFVQGSGTLVKSGGGNLSLAGGAFYTGNTIIEEGTLTMSFPDFSDEGTVEIANGATLHLAHNQQDEVAGLRVGNTTLDVGVYNSTTHPQFISGSGSLVVVESGSAYDDWIASFPSLSGASAEMSADPDGDGLTNLEEFAFDSDPTSGAASGKFRAGIRTVGAENALVLTVPVRQGATFAGGPSLSATVDGVIYTIRGTNDLGVFDQSVLEITADAAGLPDPSDGWEYRSFRLTGVVGGAGSRGPRGFIDAEADSEE